MTCSVSRITLSSIIRDLFHFFSQLPAHLYSFVTSLGQPNLQQQEQQQQEQQTMRIRNIFHHLKRHWPFTPSTSTSTTSTANKKKKGTSTSTIDTNSDIDTDTDADTGIRVQPHYRGFSSSIAHQFIHRSSERTDACSLVCCGILQADRDRYLLTGIPPPSCSRRVMLHFSYHILLPVFLFVSACFAAYNIQDVYYNQLACTVLVALMFTIVVMQSCKGRWKRSAIRRDLLFRTYEYKRGRLMEEPDDDDEDSPDYMQGQSNYDVMCVHAFIGCYTQDKTADHFDVKPKDLMGCLWKFYTQLCCGKICRCYLQVCGMCGIAQEARELESIMPSHRRRIDYITMQSWSQYYPAILKARATQQLTINLSQLSIFLLQAWVMFFVVLVGVTLWLKFSYGHVLVCLGVFLHSFFFMGMVHWIWHKHHVSLDLVIKAFSCGFFLSSTLAFCWETVIGMMFRLIMDIMLAISGIEVAVDTDGYTHSFRLPGGFATASAERSDYLKVFGQDHPFVYAIYLAFAAFCLAALIEELVRYLGYAMVTDHPDFWNRSELENAIDAVVEDVLDADQNQDQLATSPSLLRDLPIQTQQQLFKIQGAMITVIMVAVALGFACCENLVYIFIYSENSVVMEVSVLIARMIFPVHPICAAIQSIGIVRRDVERSPHSELGRALFPAIVLHGTFDFVLMLCDFLNQNNGAAGEFTAIALALLIVIAGVTYYFNESAKQRQRLEKSDRQSTVDQSTLL